MTTLAGLAAGFFKETIKIGDAIICPADYPPLYMYAKPINSSSLPFFTAQRDTLTGRTGYKPNVGITFVGLGIITMNGAGSSAGPVYLGTSDVDAGAQSGSAPTGYAQFMIGCAGPLDNDIVKTSHFYMLDGARNKFLSGECNGSGSVILNIVGIEIPTPIY